MAISVDASMPGGNVAEAYVEETEQAAIVRFTAAAHGGTERLWFRFRIDGLSGESKRQVRLVLDHPDTMLGAQRPETLRPVIRHDGADWKRTAPAVLQEQDDGRRSYAWNVDAPRRTLDVAFCYPYGPREVDGLVGDLDGYLSAHTIGVSQGDRAIVRLSNSSGNAGRQRPGVYLSARQHSGETPGSWVLDGVLREFASLGDKAPMVWAVPLTNIDGVMEGDYGKDPSPRDLNRSWSQPPMRHEVMAMQRDIDRWRERCTPALAVDFHAPGGCEDTGVYAFIPNPAKQSVPARAVAPYAEAIAEKLGEHAAIPFTRVAHYASRWEDPDGGKPTINGWFTSFGIPSMCVETPYGMIGDLVLTVQEYREIGRRVATGIVNALEKRA